jgi:hypothetical protein
VRIPAPLSDHEYASMYRRIARHNTVVRTMDPIGSLDAGSESGGSWFTLGVHGVSHAYPYPMSQPPPYALPEMTFRYPPLPRNGGFGIYGPLRLLQLSAAAGTLSVGDRHVVVGPRQELRLSDLTQLRKDGAIPVPIEASGRTATFDFQASSRVAVDGVDQTRFFARHAQALQVFSLILVVVSTLGGIMSSGLLTLRRRG